MARFVVWSVLAALVVVACGEDAPATRDATALPDASVRTDAGTASGAADADASGDAGSDASGVAGCTIDGVHHDDGDLDPANACRRCDASQSATAWLSLAEGAACGDGKVCANGSCAAKCRIDGTFHDAGTANPANECEACRPESSTSAWTAREIAPLLVGGIDPTTQGWTIVSVGQPASLTLGADYTRLVTATTSGGRVSGQQLLSLANAVPAGRAFGIRVVLQLEAVNGHNSLDSGAAIMGSLTGSGGGTTDRSQMIYLDADRIGWADDTASFPFALTDGAYHTVDLVVAEDRKATVTIDGAVALTRNNFTTTGTIAVGDQTNDPNVDGTMRVRSVGKICPAAH